MSKAVVDVDLECDVIRLTSSYVRVWGRNDGRQLNAALFSLSGCTRSGLAEWSRVGLRPRAFDCAASTAIVGERLRDQTP